MGYNEFTRNYVGLCRLPIIFVAIEIMYPCREWTTLLDGPTAPLRGIRGLVRLSYTLRR